MTTRLRRTLKSKLAYLCLSILLLGGFFFLYAYRLHLAIDPFFSRQQSQRLLAAASTQQQLKEAVGSLGAFFSFPDDSWMAIRYRDSHAGGIWSVAIARDSGGNWYQSREHFCGVFGKVRDELEYYAAISEPLPSTDDQKSAWIQRLAASPNLATARERIESRYFNRIK